jgi:protease PrsW
VEQNLPEGETCLLSLLYMRFIIARFISSGLYHKRAFSAACFNLREWRIHLAQNISFQPAQPAQPVMRRGRSWLRVLLIGLALFIVTVIVMLFTGNPNLYPTVILIGNFLVPVVFVAFLYDHRHFSALTPTTVAVSFVIGGVLGVLGASILESILLPPTNPNQGLTLGSALIVGLIEEGCKIIAVIILARRISHTSSMDGLLLGGAVGMGFAALESTGYAFTTFLTTGGHVTGSIIVTILRGLVAPFGHGIWTAILGAVLFRQSSSSNHFRLTIPVILTYLFVSALHGFWDGLPNTIYFVIPPGIPISIVGVAIAIVGLVTMFVLYRRSIKQQPEHLENPTYQDKRHVVW